MRNTVIKRLSDYILVAPADTALRDTVSAALFAQGVVRLIDGQLFHLTPLAYGSNLLYGVVLTMLGVWLAATRHKRRVWYGALAAATTSMFYVWLAYAVWRVSVTSAVAAAIYAVAMFAEARAWSGSGVRGGT